MTRPHGRSRVAALRGVAVGAVVVAVWLVALQASNSLIPASVEYDRQETRFLIALAIAVPGSLITALLVAQIARLRRPWLVSAVGLFLAAIFGVVGGALGSSLPDPFSELIALACVLGSYGGTAVFCGPSVQPSRS